MKSASFRIKQPHFMKSTLNGIDAIRITSYMKKNMAGNVNKVDRTVNSENGRKRLSIIEGAQTCVRWWGKELLEVENHGGVLEFTDECIRLYSKMGIIRIEGRTLDIRLADSESIIINGIIESISYEKSKIRG